MNATAAAALAALLLAAGLAAGQGQVQIATAGGVATAANAKVDAAAITPASPVQGNAADLSASVRNTGNAAGNISARITITPPAGGGAAFLLINSTAQKAAGASLVLAAVGCANCTATLGTWTVLVQALVNGTVSDARQFTYNVAAPPPPGPAGGAGGAGGGAAALPPTGGLGSAPAPRFGDIAFLRQPVIVEVRPGDAREVDFLIANNNETHTLTLSVLSLLPEEWVYFPQKAIGLPGKERAFVKAVLTPPKEAQPGDYRVAVKLAEGSDVRSETFVILRVKTPAPGLSAPGTHRVLDVDNEKNQTRVTLVVRSGERPVPRLEVVEEIPKTIVPRASLIRFTEPPEILQWDPVVKWTLLDLLANETRTLSYSVDGVLPEWAPYIYFPIKQVTATFEDAPPSFKVEASGETLAPGGTGKLTVALENLLKNPQRVQGRVDPPARWGVSPPEFAVDLPGLGRRETVVTLSVPSDAPGGTQSLVLTLSAEGSTRVVALEVVVRPGGWDWLLVVVLAVAGALFLIYYVRRQERRAFDRLLRLESLRRIR
jgi:hypothetical protein